MKSVFTKTWIQVVLLLCFAFVAIAIIASEALNKSDFADFRLDAATDSELIAYRLSSHEVSNWEELLKDYETEFNLRVGGVLNQLNESWQIDNENPSLYTKSIESDPWESAWKIPDSSSYLWLVDDGETWVFTDFIEVFSPLALVFLIVGASLFLLSRKVARPIRQLTLSSQALAAGESGVRVGGDFDEPFGSLANNFDSMADRIERLIADQQILIGALPHELRGPVSRLRFGLDLTRNVENLPEMRKRISALDIYLNDLEQVLEQTLLLTRLQHQDKVKAPEVFDLQQVITEIFGKFDTQQRIRYVLEIDTPSMVHGIEGLVRLALFNLLSNATRYAKSKVLVRVFSNSEKNICMTVEDDGPGVPVENQSDLFVPFSRIDESRSRESGGIGLGLSLVELIARQHGGRVSYFSSQMHGAGFKFCWPGISAM